MAMINVTKTFLPPLEEYQQLLRGIWERGQVTNHGPLVRQLETELAKFLNVPHLRYICNGTAALQLALKVLSISGEVITTPYSYVATCGAILWERCMPVFVDVDEDTMCIDPEKIEDAVTPRTEAIVTTHIYGYPCNIEAIDKIAQRHGLKVVYDAAHTFGVKWRGCSLASYGDSAALSFHATKLFHTIEGGAVVTSCDEIAEKLELHRAFGHRGDEHFTVGINAKNSELHAAMGICMLPMVSDMIVVRTAVSELYDELLCGSGLRRPVCPEDCEYNYAYYPVIFATEGQMLRAKAALEAQQIFPRRYFYPSLNQLPYVQGEACPIAESLSRRVLCLPLYPGLEEEDVHRIAGIVLSNL